MENFGKNLANLIKVKTLVTIALIGVFSVLALQGEIPADSLTVTVTSVLSFYFGTQHEKGG